MLPISDCILKPQCGAAVTSRSTSLTAPPSCPAVCGDLWPGHLVQTLAPQVDQSSEDAGRERLPALLHADQEGDPENPPALHLRRLRLPQRFGNSPAEEPHVG